MGSILSEIKSPFHSQSRRTESVISLDVNFPDDQTESHMWPVLTKGAVSRWGRYELQAETWGTITVSSTGLSYLGPIRAAGRDVRDNHYVLRLALLLQLVRNKTCYGNAWFRYQIKLYFRFTFLPYQSLNNLQTRLTALFLGICDIVRCQFLSEVETEVNLFWDPQFIHRDSPFSSHLLILIPLAILVYFSIKANT